jgi:hypothetical protein
MLTIDGRRQVDGLEAGALRARVAVDQPDDLGAIASRTVEVPTMKRMSSPGATVRGSA